MKKMKKYFVGLFFKRKKSGLVIITNFGWGQPGNAVLNKSLIYNV